MHRDFLFVLDGEKIPNSVQVALKIPAWKLVVEKEVRALESNKTWILMMLPLSKKPVGCKWIFPIKYKVDGGVKWLKSRFVAKGFT